MVWPSVNYYHTFNGVIESYTKAAKQSESLLLRVGEVWKNYIYTTDDNSLYDTDQFHPSKKGAFLAAWVIFHTLYANLDLNYKIGYSNYIDENSFKNIKDSFKYVTGR